MPGNFTFGPGFVLTSAIKQKTFPKPLDRLYAIGYIFPAMSKKKTEKPVVGQLQIGKQNYWIFLAGVALIILGYLLMAAGGTSSTLSLVISPLILLVAYLVIIPIAIMYRKRSPDTAGE